MQKIKTQAARDSPRMLEVLLYRAGHLRFCGLIFFGGFFQCFKYWLQAESRLLFTFYISTIRSFWPGSTLIECFGLEAGQIYFFGLEMCLQKPAEPQVYFSKQLLVPSWKVRICPLITTSTLAESRSSIRWKN